MLVDLLQVLQRKHLLMRRDINLDITIKELMEHQLNRDPERQLSQVTEGHLSPHTFLGELLQGIFLRQ